jgi:5-(carboxyamino)imidazole ribonucleotide synthase
MKRTPFQAGFTLGFIGGGQLARMSALQAFRFGMNIAVYATSKSTEPVENMTPTVFRGDMNDEARLIAFARSCDVITLENEFLDSKILQKVADKSGTPIFPTPESFAKIEDKLIEKRTFAKAGIPIAAYRQITSPSDLDSFGDEYGWPFVLKSAKGGYDGYGNATVRSSEDAVRAWSKLGGSDGRAVLAEAFVPFTMELAVMVARNEHGMVVYPCVESIQQGHICKEIIVPARVPQAIQVQAQELAKIAVEAIDGVGLFGFEFFLTHSNELILNESAPRPHNSGHYTIEACATSQFENHVRAVCGLPLGDTTMNPEVAVMINILGTQNGAAEALNTLQAMQTPGAHLHLYGKAESREGRKMAHLTLTGNDIEETLTTARELANSIEI